MTTDQRRKAAALRKLLDELPEMTRHLDSDVQFAVAQWRENPASQFWRRTLVRCLCASIEGVLAVLKHATPKTADFFDVPLTKEDTQVVTEHRDGRPFFLPVRKNLKKTFELFAKAHATTAPVNFKDGGYGDLCRTYEMRNDLMHPKQPRDLEVSESAIAAADRGAKWFRFGLEHVLLKECGKKLPFAKQP